MNMIDVNTSAPDFALDDVHEQSVRLSDYKGQKVLLSWHPAAWTGVCADQMRALEVNFDRFQKLGTVPFGLSVDSAPSKKAWSAVLNIEKLRLLCDIWPHGQAARDYGIFIEDWGISKRVNIIVDENGVIRWAKVYELSELPDIEEVFAALAAL